MPFIIELTEPGNPNCAQGLRVPDRAAPARAVAARPTRSCSPRPTWSPTQLVELLRRRRRLQQPHPHALRLHAQRPADARAGPAATRSRSSTRCATPRRCRPAGSGPRSCATTTRSTCPGSPPSSATEVFAEFGPDENMRLYDRGIRRRLAPMLGNDRRRIELAYALQFSLRGTPVLRYGEEIGMGEDLSLRGRDAIRTPMQWSDLPNAGFSTAPAGRAASGRSISERRVRLRDGQRDRAAPRPGVAAVLVRADDPHAAGGARGRRAAAARTSTCRRRPACSSHRADDRTGTMVFLHNLGAEAGDRRPEHARRGGRAAQRRARRPGVRSRSASWTRCELAGYGYRWIRLRRR